MNPDIPAPDGAADEVGVVVGDAEIVDGGNCFGRADRSNLDKVANTALSITHGSFMLSQCCFCHRPIPECGCNRFDLFANAPKGIQGPDVAFPSRVS
jgi:hypothetical protein